MLLQHKLTYSILIPELRRGRDETYRRCELMTLIFDLGGHCNCRSYASWYFVGVQSANFVVWPTFVMLGLLVLELFAVYVTDRRSDGRTETTLIAPF